MALTVGEIEGVISVDDSKVDSGLSSAEGKFKGFAKKAAVLGAAAGLALAGGVVESMDIEAGNDKLTAQLGLTVKESARIGKVAGSLYAGAYGGSMEEVNNAVGAVVSSIKGMRTATSADVEAMSAKVLDLATTFEVDTTRAAQVAGQMITSGLAKDGTHAMDLLFASMQRVPAAVREDLLDAVDEYGPFMDSLGIKGAKAMDLLVQGAEKGMFGIDKTGDAIKEFTIRATDMSSASKEGFDAIGLSQEKMTGKLLKGGDTAKGAFTKIVKGLQGIKDPTKQSAAALALFGTPLEDLNASEIPEFLFSLTNSEIGLGKVAGAADRAGKALNDNAKTNLTSFGRQAKMAFVNIVGGRVLPIVNTVAAFLASTFGPALKGLGDVLNSPVLPALKSFGQFVAEHQTPIKIIAGLIAAVFIPHLIALGVNATITAARTGAAWIVMKAQAIASAAAHSAALVGLVGKWLLLGTQAMLHAARVAAAWLLATGVGMATAAASMIATTAMFVAKWAFMGVQALLHAAKVAAAWLIAMGPIGIVIAAVIGLVAIVIANWGKIKVVITTVWNAIKTATIAVWNAIKTALAAVWGAIKAVVTAHVNAVRAVVSAVWNAIKAVASAVWRAIVSVIRTHIAVVMAVINGLAALPGKVAAWFGRAKSAAIGKLSALIAWVRGVPGRILSALGNLGRLLFNAGADILRGLWNGIKSMGSFIKDKIIGLVSSIIPGPVKSILGIASPSKLFHEFGVNIGEGLALGIDSQTVAVANASERLAKAAASPMQQAKAEMLRHLKRGGRIFEDLSFRGNSDLVRKFSDQIADQFYGSGGKFTRSSMERFLAGGSGGMTVNGPLIGEVKTMGGRLSLRELEKDLAMQGAT